MPYHDQVVGSIEIDAHLSTSAPTDGTWGDLLQVLQQPLEKTIVAAFDGSSSRRWQQVNEPDGQTVQVLCADLKQLAMELRAEHGALVDRLLAANHR